jgi:sulfide:quinone oxidoreductase
VSRDAPLNVLIAGGGVAAFEATLALRDLAGDRVDITLLSASDEFRYRPLVVTEPFSAAVQLAFPLNELAAEAGARLTIGVLDGVDPERREVLTEDGSRVGYDVLLVATGARAEDGVPGAVTFWGGPGGGAFGTVLEELRAGALTRPVFAVPGGATWPLPLYELALQTAHELELRDGEAVVTLVTPESTPLEIFGTEASAAVAQLLADAGVRFVPRHHPVAATGPDLALAPEGSIRADVAITIPVLSGPAYRGLPHDRHGFVPADRSGVVDDVPAVFAAGDVTTFPIKQGGLAAQQAEAAAHAIAVDAGVPVQPALFTPVLRGRLLTGGTPLFLRAELGGGHGDTSTASTEPLWWPPSKIVGRRLGPFLADRAEALAHAG